MWVSFKTRPFSKVPSPSKTPSSIFVTAMDTNPLAFDPELFIQQYQSAFSDGLNLLSKLRDVPVHVCSKLAIVLMYQCLKKLIFMNSLAHLVEMSGRILH